jgi:hypothetical protein
MSDRFMRDHEASACVEGYGVSAYTWISIENTSREMASKCRHMHYAAWCDFGNRSQVLLAKGDRLQ